jgi:hypothetical protein
MAETRGGFGSSVEGERETTSGWQAGRQAKASKEAAKFLRNVGTEEPIERCS